MSSTCSVSFKFNMTLDMKIRSAIVDILNGNYFIFYIIFI